MDQDTGHWTSGLATRSLKFPGNLLPISCFPNSFFSPKMFGCLLHVRYWAENSSHIISFRLLHNNFMRLLFFIIIFVTAVQSDYYYYSHLHIKRVSELLSFIWSLLRSLVLTYETLLGGDANQFVSEKAAPVADQAWPLASFQTRAIRAAPRSHCSEWLTGRQEDHFSECSVSENHFNFWLSSPTRSDPDTMQLFTEKLRRPLPS